MRGAERWKKEALAKADFDLRKAAKEKAATVTLWKFE